MTQKTKRMPAKEGANKTKVSFFNGDIHTSLNSKVILLHTKITLSKISVCLSKNKT